MNDRDDNQTEPDGDDRLPAGCTQDDCDGPRYLTGAERRMNKEMWQADNSGE